MTATDELRRLLDERGVEWEDMSALGFLATLWHGENAACTALEGADDIPHGKVSVQACLTPEQAIDATLGRETCKLDFTAYTKGGVDFAGFRCDGCGFTQAVPSGDLWGVTRFWSYCPACGKRVVE